MMTNQTWLLFCNKYKGISGQNEHLSSVVLNPNGLHVFWMDLLSTHDFVTSYTGHLENLDLQKVDTFYYTTINIMPPRICPRFPSAWQSLLLAIVNVCSLFLAAQHLNCSSRLGAAPLNMFSWKADTTPQCHSQNFPASLAAWLRTVTWLWWSQHPCWIGTWDARAWHPF